jgi:hypothetical protein
VDDAVIVNVYAVPMAAFRNVIPVDPPPAATFDVNVPGVPTTVYLHPAVVESFHLTNKVVPFAVTAIFVGGTTNNPKVVGTVFVIPVAIP